MGGAVWWLIDINNENENQFQKKLPCARVLPDGFGLSVLMFSLTKTGIPAESWNPYKIRKTHFF